MHNHSTFSRSPARRARQPDRTQRLYRRYLGKSREGGLKFSRRLSLVQRQSRLRTYSGMKFSVQFLINNFNALYGYFDSAPGHHPPLSEELRRAIDRSPRLSRPDRRQPPVPSADAREPAIFSVRLRSFVAASRCRRRETKLRRASFWPVRRAFGEMPLLAHCRRPIGRPEFGVDH